MSTKLLTAIGLMSGTSMDGIDASIIKTDGNFAIKVVEHATLTYTKEFKLLLKAAEFALKQEDGNINNARKNFSKHIAMMLDNTFKISAQDILATIDMLKQYLNTPQISFDKIVEYSTYLHCKLIQQLLIKAGMKSYEIDVVGYHGQTLYHAPGDKISIQVGDAEYLAQKLLTTVVSDFRRNDIEHGGQGAPLAPLYHQALAVRDNMLPLAVVNCGGIANISLVTNGELDGVLGFDSGPGNGMLDQFVKIRTQFQEAMDQDGRYGLAGRVNQELLSLLHEKAGILPDGRSYLSLPPPKSLDIADFKLIPELELLSLEDGCRTLAAFTAETIVNSLVRFNLAIPQHWVLAGGGWKNPVILQELTQRLHKLQVDSVIQTADEVGWSTLMLEAELFAYLAVRCLQGKIISLPQTTGVEVAVTGGKIIHPTMN